MNSKFVQHLFKIETFESKRVYSQISSKIAYCVIESRHE